MFTDEELLAYFDERLTVEQTATVEKEMRKSESLRNRASSLVRRRDSGCHTVGEIWRRLRLSCPTRLELGAYLLGTMDKRDAAYLDFHVRTVGCRICAANFYDLEQALDAEPAVRQRRRRFFQTSVGFLPKSR